MEAGGVITGGTDDPLMAAPRPGKDIFFKKELWECQEIVMI